MGKIISLNIIKKIFDGNEDDFYKFEAKIIFPKTSEEMNFVNLKSKAIWQATSEERECILSNIKNINKIKFSDGFSYRNENLGIYFSYCFSDCLRKKFLLVVASGEIQPARFQIKILGFVESPS